MFYAFTVSRAPNKNQCIDDIELWFIVLAFVQYYEWMDFVCACKRYRMQTNTHTEEQSYKSKWWHFFHCIWVLWCAARCVLQKWNVQHIRDRNHIVCIILILFCGSFSLSLPRLPVRLPLLVRKGCTCLCVYILLLLTSIELNGIDATEAMRCDAMLKLLSLLQFFSIFGISVSVALTAFCSKSHNNTKNKSKDNQNNDQ